MLSRVAQLYGLSLVQARSMVKAATFFFAFVAGVTVFKSATNALFLARRDPTDLPYLYLATALVITLVTVGLGRRLVHQPAKPVLRGAVLGVAVVVLALSVVAAFDVRQALGVLYVAGEVYATAISVLFWARLGEVFDVRVAKRVFGGIGAAGMAGAVLGGLLIRSLAHVVPSAAWCAAAGLSLLAIRPLLGRESGGAGQIRRRRIPLLEGLGYAVKDRYPRGVAGLVLLLAVQTAAVDYAFRTGAVVSAGGDEAALTSLFGLLNAVVGVGAILFQTLFTRPLLSRLGVFAFLSVVPALAAISAGTALLWPMSFLPLFALKTVEMMGSLSLHQPAIGLLYNPMPLEMRDPVRAVVDGAVKKLGGAVGGVLLLVFGAGLEPRVLLGLVIGLAAVLLLWVRWLRPGYLAALESKLGQRIARPWVIDPSDRATRRRLVAALSDPDGNVVLSALSVLERAPKVRIADHAAELLHHPDERVRMEAIAIVRAHPDPRYAPLLRAVIETDSRRPTAQAARALALVDPEAAGEVLRPYLEPPLERHDLGLVCASIEALLSDPRGADAAHRVLDELFSHGRAGPARERRELVRLLGNLGPGPSAWRLATYLDDPEPTVQALAVDAAARARDPSLPPKLVLRLQERELRAAVIRSLAAYGEDVVPLVAEMLNDRRISPSLRVHLPPVLRRIGTKAAVDAMLFSNVRDDAFLRFVIVGELARLRRERPDAPFDRARVEAAAERRLAAYEHYLPIAQDLAAGGAAYRLLLRAVEDRVRQNLQGALRLLGLVYDREAMEGAATGLLAGQRADALELLDVALAGTPLRKRVLGALETSAPSALPDRARMRAEALVEGRDVQVATIARETLVRSGVSSPPEVVEPTRGEPLMQKSIVDRVFVLETVQLFQNLSVDDLTAVAELCVPGSAGPRETIYRERDPGDSMFVIVSGEVRLLKDGQTLLDLGAGDSFGQVSILDGGARPVTAVAGDEGVEWLVVSRAPFMDLVQDRPDVGRGLFSVLARRLRELVDLTGEQLQAATRTPMLSSTLPSPTLTAPPQQAPRPS